MEIFGQNIPAPIRRNVSEIGDLLAQINEAIEVENVPKASQLLQKIFQAGESLYKNVGPRESSSPEVLKLLENVDRDIAALAEKMQAMVVSIKAKGRKKALPYTLANVDAIAHEDPTFQIPSKKERQNLSVGDAVKLVFRYHTGGGERMWVKVTRVLKPGSYEGDLQNQSIFYEIENPIQFGYEHVASIYEP